MEKNRASYEPAKLKIIQFEEADIITASDPQLGNSSNDSSGWTTSDTYYWN